jgi:hypothetical protein
MSYVNETDNEPVTYPDPAVRMAESLVAIPGLILQRTDVPALHCVAWHAEDPMLTSVV